LLKKCAGFERGNRTFGAASAKEPADSGLWTEKNEAELEKAAPHHFFR